MQKICITVLTGSSDPSTSTIQTLNRRTKNMKTAELSINKVLSYKNQSVVERIAKEAKVTLEEAQSIFEDTLRFLYLAAVTNKPVVPTKKIDEGWHNFIMFTRDYNEFCHEYLGHFVHHCPVTSKTPKSDVNLAAMTIELATKHIGGDLSENWNFGRMVKNGCSSDTGGGGDDCTPDWDCNAR